MTRPITECPLWRWMPGMLAHILYRDHPCGPVEGDRLSHRMSQEGVAENMRKYVWMGISDHDPQPDPDDPATVGCLLALVREAWGIPGLGVHYDRLAGGWVFADPLTLPLSNPSLRSVFAPTEWDALCAALWAASERAP